ncbi:hypothetical protein [Gemmobacter sp. LW-1]|uniref:hypothetical protein n=1 Tax=Gemmobacter sp. LW-1 TaxID=1529005 RepID=UPI00128F937E|nr:hypothetical protein [Gemmobacter sp. LW-1]
MRYLLSSVLIALSTHTAYAEELLRADQPWCPSVANWRVPEWGDPDLVPDGGLVRVGARIFRSCTSPHSSSEAPRIIRLTLNPALIPKTLNRHAWPTLTLSDLLPGGEWLPSMLRSYVAVGTRMFGGTIYREYRHQESVKVEHSNRIFVYEPTLNPNLDPEPDHAISCPDKGRSAGLSVTCFVFVFHEGIRASIMMIGDGEGFPPVPRHEFPQIARDMQQVLFIADVTVRISPLKASLPQFN